MNSDNFHYMEFAKAEIVNSKKRNKILLTGILLMVLIGLNSSLIFYLSLISSANKRDISDMKKLFAETYAELSVRTKDRIYKSEVEVYLEDIEKDFNNKIEKLKR